MPQVRGRLTSKTEKTHSLTNVYVFISSFVFLKYIFNFLVTLSELFLAKDKLEMVDADPIRAFIQNELPDLETQVSKGSIVLYACEWVYVNLISTMRAQDVQLLPFDFVTTDLDGSVQLVPDMQFEFQKTGKWEPYSWSKFPCGTGPMIEEEPELILEEMFERYLKPKPVLEGDMLLKSQKYAFHSY